MGSRNTFNVQGYQPPKQSAKRPAPQSARQSVQPAQQPAPQWQQPAPQYAPNQYQSMQNMQAPGNGYERPQQPVQTWQGNCITPQQKTRQNASRTAWRGKDKLLLISAVISSAWLIISFCIIMGAVNASPAGANEWEQLGRQIGSAMALTILVPFLALTFVGAIFNWLAWGTGRKGLALTAGILFAVSLIFGFTYALGVIPCVVLSFVGYSRLKKAG